MSWMPGAKPDCNLDCADDLEMVILPRASDVGGFDVFRALPFRTKRMVGPFIYWDQMGPGEFLTTRGIDVRPHPHIGLATVTYLFDGQLMHRDSAGSNQRIHPGDVNVMWAGKGIVHSERSIKDDPGLPERSRLVGIQSWVAQPKDAEGEGGGFAHLERTDLPVFEEVGVRGRVILGEFQGLRSPAPTQWETLYVDLTLEAGARLEIPAQVEERALYALEGRIEIAHATYEPRQMLVLCPGRTVTIKALDPVRLMLLGGAVMDGPRLIWWNFVASSKERIVEAATRWKERRFDAVPGDSEEFIPLPDGVGPERLKE